MVALACTSSDPPPSIAPDAGARIDAAVEPAVGDWWRVETDDGDAVEGELVAAYDHRRWWHEASEQTTYALFVASALQPYPLDRSFRLLSSRQGLRFVPLADAPPAFREMERQRGWLLTRVPLDGVVTVVTGHESYHLQEDGFGDFAWDLSRRDVQGRFYAGVGARNEDYWVWDNPVYAPIAGTVVDVVRDAADNTPGSYPDDAVNNWVGIHLYGSYYLYLLHFRQGSIAADIEPGVEVGAGDFLGRVGNSGVSLAPHLHLSLLWYNESTAPARSWSLPCEFAGIYVRSASEPVRHVEYFDPATGDEISNQFF